MLFSVRALLGYPHPDPTLLPHSRNKGIKGSCAGTQALRAIIKMAALSAG